MPAFINIEASGVISVDRFANILINQGVAAANLEGGGVETVRAFVLITDKMTGKGIEFPAGIRIRRVDG